MQELAHEYRAILEEYSRPAATLVSPLPALVDAPARWPTRPATSPTSRSRQARAARDARRRGSPREGHGWAKEALGEFELRRRSATTSPTAWRSSSASSCCGVRWTRSARSSAKTTATTSTFRTRIAETPLSDEARKEAEREVNRLAAAGGNSAESSSIRTYLDTLLALPWGKYSEEVLDVNAARETLDSDHAGLDEVKARILEYLAVRKFRRERDISDERSGAILALVGPPGVGKTSLGESIARALGREFQRMSLGGVHDEAEIRGHRRTYVGALPGRLVRALRDAGTMNPVILLDEVDKLGATTAAIRRRPCSRCSTRRRTRRSAITTSISRSTSPRCSSWPPRTSRSRFRGALDRLEVIRLDGYTEDEKIAIAENYLVPRQATRNGLLEGQVMISTDAVRHTVADYTREAGVRSLERELSKVLRKAATKLASGELTAPISIGSDELEEYLGRPRHFAEAAERTSVAGVATGLAVTGTGGDVLFIEANTMPGKGTLTLTGQLGDVMKESASIALSYVRSRVSCTGSTHPGTPRATSTCTCLRERSRRTARPRA